MIEATQMAAVQDAPAILSVHDVPQLLIHWSSRWEEFITAIRPALARSPKPLAAEARTNIFPLRGILAAWACEVLLLSAAIIIPAKIASMQPYVPPAKPTYDVIYFSGDELPQTEDIGGAEKGKSGRAGGHQAVHRSQAIRVARGNAPVDKVVDAPKVNLPKSDLPVANLLAIRGVVGPPPTAGLRSSLPALPQADPIAPAPNVSRDQLRATPTLSSSIIAPPPEVSRDNQHRKLELATSIVGPPPDVSRDTMRNIEGVNTSIVAPPPEIAREKMRAISGVNSSIIAPPPSVQQEVAGMRAPVNHATDVVPPPVSAPVSPTATASRMTLPQPSVIAPPPSNVSREIGSSYGVKTNDIQTRIVPPPVQVGGQISGLRGGGSTPSVVPPPPSVNGGLATGRAGTYSASGTAVAAGVVPPPPTVSGGTSATNLGRAGRGLGGAAELGSVAPPTSGGATGRDAGVVVSSQPGSRVGVPGTGGSGAIAMSPTGGSKSGLGGSGGGNGIGHGNGPGSALEGEATGAATAGTGRGSDPASRSGISPYPGAGGTGSSSAATSRTPGISVSGGNTITLPSFGGGGTAPNVADPSRVRDRRTGPGITVVASSRSGGAFNFYGALKGDPVYTIYMETSLGVAVLQYADPTSTKRVYAQELRAPEPMRADLPAGLARSRLVIACVLDHEGLIRNVHVLEPGPAQMTASVVAALRNWKFKPAFRADQPVEVNAILGFNIDTR